MTRRASRSISTVSRDASTVAAYRGTSPIRNRGTSPIRNRGTSPINRGTSPVRNRGTSPVRNSPLP